MAVKRCEGGGRARIGVTVAMGGCVEGVYKNMDEKWLWKDVNEDDVQG